MPQARSHNDLICRKRKNISGFTFQLKAAIKLCAGLLDSDLTTASLLEFWCLALQLTEDEDASVRSNSAACLGEAMSCPDEDLSLACVAYIQRRCFVHMMDRFGGQVEYVQYLLDQIYRYASQHTPPIELQATDCAESA